MSLNPQRKVHGERKQKVGSWYLNLVKLLLPVGLIVDGTGGVKALFKRIALLLGSLHLTLMASLGIRLWHNPRSFGISDANCAVDVAHLAIVGAHVPFGSTHLRAISLAMYGLFLLPGLNLLLPMAAFLGLYLWHQGRLSEGGWPERVVETMPEEESRSFFFKTFAIG
jgi:hypothetical protein